MNETDLLNCVRKNLEMGIDGIKTVRGYAKSERFADALDSQLKEYEELYNDADRILGKYGGKTENVPAAAKVFAEISGTMKSMMGGADEKIAEEMVRGNTTGSAKLTRQYREYDGDKSDVRELVEKVIDIEEKHSREMKKFL